MTVPYIFADASQSMALAELDANFAAVGSADNIEYTPTFTNSISETVSQKLGQTVNVMDFIPPGTNTEVTDCTTYIQNAINYVCSIGGTLEFATGNYTISSALIINEPINIHGNRSQIYQKTANNNILVFNAGTGAGNIRNTTVVKDLILGCVAGSGNGIYMYQFMNCTFQDITIVYAGNCGVWCVGGILNVFNNVRVSGTMPASPGFFVNTGMATQCNYGFKFEGGDVSQANANTLIQCYCQNSAIASYWFEGNNNNTILNCDSEFSPSPTGKHIYANGEINLNVISGDYEGTTSMYFVGCTSPTIMGSFVNFQVEFASGTIGASVKGGVYKIITIDSGAINTSIDDINLYTGASGINNSGTNTWIGSVYNMQTSNMFAGGKWYQQFTPVLNIGGTPTTTGVTRAQGYAQLMNNFLLLEVAISWSSLSGSGAITVDCSSVIPNVTGRYSTLCCDLEKVTPGANYGQVFAQVEGNGFIQILKASTNGSGSASVNLSDTGTLNYLFISGIVRY